jgi:uncharacterized membrane protein SpoIIM required for sporulation
MILDLHRFVREGRPHWDELDALLTRLEAGTGGRLNLEEAKRLHHLYQRTSADLARVMTFAAEPEIRAHLESLVGRAYGEIHRHRRTDERPAVWRWFIAGFPGAFRRRLGAFWLAVLATIAGAAFGAGAVLFDPDSKAVLLPFGHLLGDPADRVAEEERAGGAEEGTPHATFSAYLMTHNIQVAVLTLALGITWGFGTLVIIFYNGVILGAVVADYIAAGQTTFLVGWLLPHGSVEIPAFLIAAQAGLVLGGALIGRGDRAPMVERLRGAGPDIATLIGGVAVLLVWAGIVESFLSQYHEPVVPYAAKITFGAVQLTLLATFLILSGRRGSLAVTRPERAAS